mmetsp:Transcript_116629/g.362377  ORF Transcript_116629/g.362377 Transcript_116629/m.362377 type:complete len:220 (-) Transcript_116629:363-1022(-)
MLLPRACQPHSRRAAASGASTSAPRRSSSLAMSRRPRYAAKRSGVQPEAGSSPGPKAMRSSQASRPSAGGGLASPRPSSSTSRMDSSSRWTTRSTSQRACACRASSICSTMGFTTSLSLSTVKSPSPTGLSSQSGSGSTKIEDMDSTTTQGLGIGDREFEMFSRRHQPLRFQPLRSRSEPSSCSAEGTRQTKKAQSPTYEGMEPMARSCASRSHCGMDQ